MTMWFLLFILAVSPLRGASADQWSSTELSDSACFMQKHFEMARTCWGQKKMPSRSTQRGMIRGFVAGEQRFWPGRVDWTREAFAYAISETGGLIVDNGKEFGCCGLWAETARCAGYRWNIPMPHSERGFRRKLREDPEYCAFMTVATLAYCSACCEGGMPNAVAGMIFGDGDFQYLARRLGTDRILDWPYVKHGKVNYPMRHWVAIVGWLRCIESGHPCSTCEPDMERMMSSKP